MQTTNATKPRPMLDHAARKAQFEREAAANARLPLAQISRNGKRIGR